MKSSRNVKAKAVSAMSDEKVVRMLQETILSLTQLPKEQRVRIRGKITDDNRHKAKQQLMSVGLLLDAVNIMTMKNFNKVINGTRTQTTNLEEVKTNPEMVSMDSFDQAQLDLRFVHAVLDTLFSISGQHMDELDSSTVCSLTSEALDKVRCIQKFIDTVPAENKTTEKSAA